MKKVKSKEDKIKDSENYLIFLKNRLDSKNYKLAVSEDEFQKTKAKYDKEKLILKLLK
jgi:hypothetical protein